MLEIGIFAIAFFLGFLFSKIIYETPIKKLDFIGRLKGYHFHHSMYGVTTIFFAPFTLNHNHILISIFLVAFGLGVIVDHTIEEGFIFITKDEQI